MTKSKKLNRPRSRSARTGAVMLVAAVATAGTLVATALASSGSTVNVHRTARRAGLAVLAHPPRGLARIATAGSVSAPNGAILAAVVGQTDVYVSHNSSGEDCVEHFTVGAAGGGGCAPAALVEERGSVGVFQEGDGATAPDSPATLRVTALVPNDVANVKFTDRDGSSYEVAVTNNVVEHEDVNIASVSYRLADGASQTTNVAAIVDRTPRRPGPPGSSK